MIKAHKKFNTKTMRRSCRVFLNELNQSKKKEIFTFLIKCHDITQYFVDFFWQKEDFTSVLAPKEITDKAKSKFNTTTRLSQALAKQAKETIRSQIELRKEDGRKLTKPKIKKHIVTLYYHFVTIEKFNSNKNTNFDFAVNLIGSGAPRLTLPVKSTKHLNKFLNKDWKISKTIRLGRYKDKIFIDFIVEKPTLPRKQEGNIVGMDSNYKAGLVFSDRQIIGEKAYERIQGFSKRQKHTHEEIKSLIGFELKKIDFSKIKELCIENLKNVKSNKRGKFPCRFNRRLSHWMYSYMANMLSRVCEEKGVRLSYKDPWKTSQTCHICHRWDKRNRRGDKFLCVHCGHVDNSDFNASKNLEFLGLAGVYSLRLLPNSKLVSSFG